ncbi:HAD family hydrolase [Pseudoalteromonas obscura]|uniref:phosphoglycolate phosphatase n=1 Tax=Pseudoalteromonas obscura TaxID=3048491 RepID=A0ABT7EQ10_9GAMM|nr:HAD family hydrolase [Pseudoalteromonas sp. P94(2023)]MDK2597141.1 HAD family hydrolase [Pseudoalteromonas sp. P94(2023)]
MNIQGVLLDLDGTLVNSIQDMHLALNLALSDVAFPVVSYKQVQLWVGNGIDTLVQRGLSCDSDINPDLSATLVKQATERFKAHYQQLVGEYAELYPGVEIGLYELGNVPKALVTNKDRAFTLQLLQKLNIAKHFDVIVCGDDGNKKPDPQLLKLACEQLGVSASQAIMIGDSKSDILAAHSAEIPVIALNYGYNQGEALSQFNPQYLCEQFSDIIPILTNHN